jgi:hypothetical protein
VETSAAGSVVVIKETTPVHCVLAQHVTNQYSIISTAKLPAPVTFEVLQLTHTCT